MIDTKELSSYDVNKPYTILSTIKYHNFPNHVLLYMIVNSIDYGVYLRSTTVYSNLMINAHGSSYHGGG